jgi:NADH dehydrogenase
MNTMPDIPKTANAASRVVIVGAGFGGLSAAKALAHAPVEIIVIDRQNYHLFQPLLYQVATASLSPGDIAWPIRRILRRQRNAQVLLGEVTAIDTKNRTVTLGEQIIAYDYLILATGVRHDYFGHADWEAVAPGLKELDDATGIRRRILLAFEHAEMLPASPARNRLLTFVIVGGGPTGVELAGAIAELARKALATDFRNIDPRSAHIILVEAGPRLLPSFPEDLSAFAARALTRLGVDVRLGKPMTECNANGVTIGDVFIPAATVLWGAGVAASPVARWLGAAQDRAGRVLVQSDFSAPGLPNIFVIGDAAHVEDKSGRLLPGVAPVAKQAGNYVARMIAARIAGKKPPSPFRYLDWGNLATIGRRAAVIDFGWLRLKGGIAWWVWGIAHIYFLIGLRNRIIVALQWLWSYLAFERGARLITGSKRIPAIENSPDA